MLTRTLLPLSLDRELDRAFGSVWNATRGFVPALDVVETRDAYIVTADLPGIEPATVELNFERNTLSLRGAKPASKVETENGEARVHTAERLSGSFQRAIRLPEYVDAEKITASFSNGVLTVVVPKSSAALSRKIEISAASKN